MSGPTRGSGLLEGFLSQKRSVMATKLLDEMRISSILDIGSGSDPLFLKSSTAPFRVGVDRLVPSDGREPGISIAVADVGATGTLPFKDASFDAVTMLAVLEHLPPASVLPLLDDIHRVLTDRGILVLTTPPPRTNALLKVLARFRIVSPEEIDEHERAYSARQLERLLNEGSFAGHRVEVGTFELGMNLWARVSKQGGL